MDDYNYDEEYANFDTQDFDTLGDTTGWYGDSGTAGGYEGWQTPQSNNSGGYDFNSEYNNWDTGSWDQLGNTDQYQPITDQQFDFNSMLNNGPNPGQGYGGFTGNPNQQGFDWSKLLGAGSGVLKDLFAPRAGNANTGSDAINSLVNMFKGAAGLGKTGLSFMAANDEREKQQKYLDFVKDLTMRTQQTGALDPSAPYRQEAAQYWQQNNPTLQTLLSGGTTANMQQELNAARLAAQRQGGKSGNRFSAFAARQEPYMMAQARNNDFKMQQEAQKQRWAELATKGDTGGLLDLAKMNAGAYRDSLTNPMYAAASKALQEFTGQGPSVSGDQMSQILEQLAKINSNTRQS